jgi:hypothetical protein
MAFLLTLLFGVLTCHTLAEYFSKLDRVERVRRLRALRRRKEDQDALWED